MNSTSGYCWLNTSIIASRPAASPPPVHHENTSTSPAPAGASVAGASVAGISVGASVIGASVAAGSVAAGASVGAAPPQAVNVSAVIVRTAIKLYHILVDIFSSPCYVSKSNEPIAIVICGSTHHLLSIGISIC